MTNKTLLVITDGIGHNSSNKFNAFFSANTPTYDYLFKNTPYSLIHTYGKFVGLPDGQMGNSEVGHMTIGSGRILYQDLVKVNIAIENDTLKDNLIFKNILNTSNNIHLIGLLSDGGVHSHIEHIIAMAKISKTSNKKVFIHIITDGRDVAPDCAKIYIKRIVDSCNDKIRIATIGGRYYGMDRDNRWDRVEKAYNSMAYATPRIENDIKIAPLPTVTNYCKNTLFSGIKYNTLITRGTQIEESMIKNALYINDLDKIEDSIEISKSKSDYIFYKTTDIDYFIHNIKDLDMEFIK